MGGGGRLEQERRCLHLRSRHGRLVTRLGRLGNVIHHLAFSPDNSRLAATTDGEGMRLWEAGSWRLLAEDKDYGGKRSEGAAFDSANRLFTVARDGQIRRYGADGRLEAKAKAAGGAEPYSIAVHPKGGKLAVGFSDTTAVEVYDVASLRRLYAADTGGEYQGVLAVNWGQAVQLFTPLALNIPAKRASVVTWQDEGRGKRSEAPLSQDTIMQLLPCGEGLAAGAARSRLWPDCGGWRQSASGRRASPPICGANCAMPSRFPPMARASASA